MHSKFFVKKIKYFSLLIVFTVLLCFADGAGCNFTSSARTKVSDVSIEGFAVLQITLDGYNESDIDRNSWSPIKYTLRYDDTIIRGAKAQIKGRGNYTWGQAKRPYAIKCDEKTDWFGFGAAKDWVLLANYTDQTHLRNYIAFKLAAKFSFAFTPEVRPCHVFINGQYNGLYLVAEKVEIDKKRLDINPKAGAVLLELDNNYGSGEPVKFTSSMGNTYVIKDPDQEEYNELTANLSDAESFNRVKLHVKTAVNAFEEAIIGGASLEELSGYMDMDSFVDWYIFNEIEKNDDTLFNSSIYLYYDEEGILHMGPVWDYDLAMGGIDRNDGKNVSPEGLMFSENYWDRPNWFDYLLNREDFMSLVKARWTGLYNEGVFTDILTELDTARLEVYTHYEFDYERWQNGGVFVRSEDYQQAVDSLKSFYAKRVKWLDSVWNDGSLPCENESPENEESSTPEITGSPDVPPDESESKAAEASNLYIILICVFCAAVSVSASAFLIRRKH